MKARKSIRLVRTCPECGCYAHAEVFDRFKTVCYKCGDIKEPDARGLFKVQCSEIDFEYTLSNLKRNIALVGLNKLSMSYRCSTAPMSQQVKRARFLERNNPVIFEGYTKYVLSGKG